jgi:hypothetical protein
MIPRHCVMTYTYTLATDSERESREIAERMARAGEREVWIRVAGRMRLWRGTDTIA